MIDSSATTGCAPLAVADQRRAGECLRRGVTLVELLVVMVILTILSSLTLSGLLVARNRSKQVKTISTIRKLSEVILPYYEEYETRRPQLDRDAVARITRNGSGFNRQQLAEYKRIALRRLMTLELPDRAVDVNPQTLAIDPEVDGSSTPLIELPPATRRYRYLISQASGSVTSSDLLHMIVTRGVVADPDIIAHFRDDEVADVNDNGFLEFIDGWGNPIAFKRWPVGFDSPLQPITGSLGDVEPLVSPRGHRLMPLIYSAGRDESYDIMADAPAGDSWDFASVNYDPFSFRVAAGEAGHAPVKGEIFLVPGTAGNVETFTAARYDGGSPPAGAFQTLGSPRDTGSSDGDEPNGRLESADNIHNHDLRQ